MVKNLALKNLIMLALILWGLALSPPAKLGTRRINARVCVAKWDSKFCVIGGVK